MAFYLEGKIPFETKDLCPKEATAMSREAVGLKSQIGSWLALKPTLSLRSFGTERSEKAISALVSVINVRPLVDDNLEVVRL